MNFSLTSCEIGPNFQLDDALIALSSPFLFSSNKTESKDFVVNFFGNKYNNHFRPKYFTAASRTSLYLLLKSLNLPPNSQVALQAFSCVVVPNAVLQAGLKPLILDVNSTNYNLDHRTFAAVFNPNVKVLIIQHTFGLAADWTEIVNFCNQNNVIIIEDCAHALGTYVNINNKMVEVGNIGQACFFSFGRDKIISCTSGGVALIKEEYKQWNDEMEKNYAKLEQTNWLESIRLLVYIWSTTLLIRPFYGLFGKALFKFMANLQFLGDVYTLEEKEGTSKIINAKTLHPNLFPVLANQISKLENFNLHRKEIAKIYSNKLGIKYVEGSVFLRFPVRVNSEEYNQIKQALKTKNILLGQWYLSPFIPLQTKADKNLDKFFYSAGNCPVVESLIQEKVLNLPTNPNTSFKTALEIAEKFTTIRLKFDKAE